MTIYLTNILVRYLGIENLTNAFSIVTIIRGLGSLSGPPLAGESNVEPKPYGFGRTKDKDLFVLGKTQ